MLLICQNNVLDKLKEFNGKVIIYGAGTVGRKVKKLLPRVDFFCDMNAENLNEVEKIKVIKPADIDQLDCEVIVIYAVRKNEEKLNSFLQCMECLKKEVEIYNYFDNVAFNQFDFDKYRYTADKNQSPMRVCIVQQDDGWIIQKFGNKMYEELKKLGVDVHISDRTDPDADINHFVSFMISGMPDYGKIVTFMITHVDSKSKIDFFKQIVSDNRYGICMSEPTMNYLASNGVCRDNLSYINPAQDGVIKPKKVKIGLTHRLYNEYDVRKRGSMILDVCKQLNPEGYCFSIMGSGWDSIVESLRKQGFEVQYWNDFVYEDYITLMSSLDYWMYYGNDEGNMGYLDALAAGVKTLVTPQGFHLDIHSEEGTCYCKCVKDFARELRKEGQKREEIAKTIEDYTWETFTKKHLELWEYLLKRKTLPELFQNQHLYADGIYSVLINSLMV